MIAGMTLDEYLRSRDIPEQAFAAAIGVSQPAVHRYRRGMRRPSKPVMTRIVASTGGMVQPNDFHAADMGPAPAGPKGE